VSDETYILELCDVVLQQQAKRQHRFDFLQGDTGRRLPVDAYYPNLKLVVEYRERQHTEAVPFWDRKATPSGITRGEQRRRYDQRRRDVLPMHGLSLIELNCTDFPNARNKRLLRKRDKDEELLREKLAAWLSPSRSPL
jgi:hypothetical protein